MRDDKQRRLKFIGCEILYREACYLAATTPHIVDLLRKGNWTLLRKLFEGRWDEDFVVLQPGRKLLARNDQWVLDADDDCSVNVRDVGGMVSSRFIGR